MASIRTMSNELVLTDLTPIMDNLMQGSAEINYAKHTRDFTDRLKAQLSSERLEQLCRDYQKRIGHFGRREFVALFRREHSVAVIWRQQVSRSDDELVAEAVFVPIAAGWQVDHAMVF
jgi:hypothetical protein